MAGLAGEAGHFGRAGNLRLNAAGPASPARPVWPQITGRKCNFSDFVYNFAFVGTTLHISTVNLSSNKTSASRV